MWKKILCGFLCASLFLATVQMPLRAEAGEVIDLDVDLEADETEELLEVTLDVVSSGGCTTLGGIYGDNVFYVKPEDICRLGDASVMMDEDNGILTFLFFGSQRVVSVGLDGVGEEYFNTGVETFSVPVKEYEGEFYISLLHLFRYMGIPVTFAAAETEDTHLYVSSPYTIYEAYSDYRAKNGYHFSWDETGKNLDVSIFFAGLDATFLHYDPSIRHYIFSSGNVEKQKLSDALFAVVTNEGQEYNEESYLDVNALKYTNTALTTGSTFVKFIERFAYGSNDLAVEIIGYFLDFWCNASSTAVSYADGIVTGIQYGNMAGAQKDLLSDTLLRYDETTELYQMAPLLFQAAASVDEKLKEDFQVKDEAAGEALLDGGKNLAIWVAGIGAEKVPEMIYSQTPGLPYPNLISAGVGYASLFLDVFEAINTLIAVSDDPLIQRDIDLVHARTCADVDTLMREIEYTDYQELLDNGMYHGSSKGIELLNYLKSDMILSLKASMKARELFISSGRLDEEAELAMEEIIKEEAVLLNKVENAYVLQAGYPDAAVDDDLSWIANLAGQVYNNGGRVVKYQGNTYYWRFHAESVSETGFFGNFTLDSAVENELIRVSADGTEEVILKDTGTGTLYISGGKIFYEKSYGQWGACDLDGSMPADYQSFQVLDVDDERNILLYMDFDDSSIRTLRKGEKSGALFSKGGYYLGIHEGKLYDAVIEENLLSVYEVDYESGETRLIGTKAVEENDFMGGINTCNGKPMDDGIYISYGIVGGTGLYYNTGGIVFMAYDGSDVRTLVEQGSEEDLKFEEFYIAREEGNPENRTLYYYIGESVMEIPWLWRDLWVSNSVRAMNLETGEIMDSSFILSDIGDVVYENGSVMMLLDDSGVYTEILSPDMIAGMGYEFGESQDGRASCVSYVDIVEDTVYFSVEEMVRDTEKDMGWRPAYQRICTSLYTTELGSGVYELIYQY